MFSPLVLCLLLVHLACWQSSVAGPLDDYVNRPDPTYKYEQIDEHEFEEYTVYTLNMTSQTWKPDLVPTHPVWWHYLVITIPHNIRNYSTAFMLIDGGSNHASLPKPTDNFVALTSMFAVGTGCVGADLQQIPNEPIVFKDDPSNKSRSEDAIIAWTWKKFVLDDPNDPEILLRMPMTKAAVRAMDTVSDFAKKKIAEFNIDKYMVAGASKRGWTTWTTAAVDSRVIAACPLVMDLLNMVENLHHFYRAYGGWTFAFDDYYALNFTEELDNPNVQKMAQIVDPIAYKERLTMPKMIVSTGGDEFFLPDDSHYYYSQMQGPTFLSMTPNAEHSMAGHQVQLFFSLRAFFLNVLHGRPFPKMSWERQTNSTGGSIVLTTDQTPTSVNVFYAKTLNNKRRDFRLVIATPGDPNHKPYPHPIPWLRTGAQEIATNTFRVDFENPFEGWLAFFIQVSFAAPEGTVMQFTTETNIIPNTFPFPDCHGASCKGTLV